MDVLRVRKLSALGSVAFAGDAGELLHEGETPGCAGPVSCECVASSALDD